MSNIIAKQILSFMALIEALYQNGDDRWDFLKHILGGLTRAGEQRHAPDEPTIELLLAIKEEAAFANGFQRDHWVERINAILKTVGGG